MTQGADTDPTEAEPPASTQPPDGEAGPVTASTESGAGSRAISSWTMKNLLTVSVLGFLVVAVKVFRVADMETSTALGIITTADTGSVLRGMLINLLPAFLAFLIAGATWLWATTPFVAGLSKDETEARTLSVWAVVALVGISLFVVVIVWFFLLFLFAVVSLSLYRRYQTRRSNKQRLPRLVGRASALIAVILLGQFLLERSVWLPQEDVTLKDGSSHVGYVLKEGGGWTTLLIDQLEPQGRVSRRLLRIHSEVDARSICLSDRPSSAWWARRPIQNILQGAANLGILSDENRLVQTAKAQTPYTDCPNGGLTPIGGP